MSMSFEEGPPSAAELQERAAADRRRSRTLTVLGAGLLALGAVGYFALTGWAMTLSPQQARFAMRAVPAGVLGLGGIGAAIGRKAR